MRPPDSAPEDGHVVSADSVQLQPQFCAASCIFSRTAQAVVVVSRGESGIVYPGLVWKEIVHATLDTNCSASCRPWSGLGPGTRSPTGQCAGLWRRCIGIRRGFRGSAMPVAWSGSVRPTCDGYSSVTSGCHFRGISAGSASPRRSGGWPWTRTRDCSALLNWPGTHHRGACRACFARRWGSPPASCGT
jgi:hypothetical protein